MGRKDDMRAALECRQPQGAVPIWELSFHCWDQASGEHLILGREFEALSAAGQDRALHANAETIARVSSEFGYAAVTVPGDYWEVAPGAPAYYWLPNQARLRQVRILRERVGEELMLIAGTGGVITPPVQGFVEFCYKLLEAPEEIDDLARGTLVGGLEEARRFRDLGVETVYTASDIADNHGPFFRPQQMQRFVLPYLHEWAEGVKRLGLYAIMHTDGDISPCLEDLASSGIHALQAIDPVAGMDIRDVKRRVGRKVCLCGNVDCGLLLLGPGPRVYEEACQLLKDCMPGGGFVLGASNAVLPETPIEHYRAMIRAWEEYGAYGG